VILVGCSSIRVEQQADPGLAQLAPRTWAFEDPPSPQEVGRTSPDTDLGQRIIAAFVRELGARGLRQVDRAEAEVVVRYYAALEQRIDLREPEYQHWRRFEEGVALGPGIVAEGSVILEVVDPKAERVVFQAVATRRNERIESVEAHIEAVVKRLVDAWADAVR
jgi:hypothetical protein